MNVQILHRSVDEPPTADSEASVPSLDEITRASRFYFEKDRIHFTRCRSASRGQLAGCLAIPTSEIRFEHLTSRKPRLAVEQNPGTAVQRIPLGRHGAARSWQCAPARRRH